MKLLLKKSIENLGRLGDIVDVANGYGRNCLLPQGKAVLPTKENMRQIEIEKAKVLLQIAKEKEDFQLLAQKIDETSITISMKASEEGHLYGSVNVQHISDQLEAEGLKVPIKWIILEEPIKELGVYEVIFRMPHEVELTTKVWVV